MKNTKWILAAVLIMGMMTVLGCSAKKPAAPVELVVSAAASLTDVLNELGPLYHHIAPEVTVTFTYGSSGALQGQIEEGAPADLFISAAKKPMDKLAEKDLIVVDSRKDLLVNQVVLITPKDSKNTLASFNDVVTDKVGKIALGEPTGVPVGQYAEEVFTTLGILESVKAKAVYGSDVRQVLTWVASGEVDCGVVYATDAAISPDVLVVTKALEGSHQEVLYPVAMIKAGTNQVAAQGFLDYLSSKEAIAVFEKYGFVMK